MDLVSIKYKKLNKTSHEYALEVAKEIAPLLPKYAQTMRKVLNKLKA